MNGSRARSAVLVTGASSGIGRATALHLAARGTLVFAGVRRPDDGDALAREGGTQIEPLMIDVTDGASIERARLHVTARTDVRLVGIVNNAGIALASPLEIVPLSELRNVFEINFFGALAVTQAFLPLLRRSRGRIVNVSSIGGKFAAPFLGPYASSKFALEAASDALRLEMRPFDVKVVLVEPGAVRTPIWSRSSESSSRMFEAASPEARAAYEPTFRRLAAVAQRLEHQGVGADRVAAIIERALFARSPRARYLVGLDSRIRLAIARMPEALRDRLVARFLGIPRARTARSGPQAAA